MKYNLIVLDLDGTLTNNKKEITPRTLESLIKVQQMGVKLVLASGRPTYGIVPLANELQMDKFGGYILAFNGGKIIDCKSGETIYDVELPKSVIPTLYDFSKKSNTQLLTYQDKYIITENPDDKYVQYELFLTKMEAKKVDSFLDSVNFAPDKCLMVGHEEILVDLEKEVFAAVGDQINVYRSEPFFLELVPKGIDKADSLQRLLDKTSGSVEQMIAIGDGFNDLSMIKFAGLGVAMENAQPAVKEAADVIALSNEEDGVAVIVEELFEL